MAQGKSIEKIQDATLAMFNIDKQRSSTFVEDQLALTAKKQQIEAERRKRQGDKYSSTSIRTSVAAFENTIKENDKLLLQKVDDISHYSEFLQEFYKLWENTIHFNKESVESIVKELKGKVFFVCHKRKIKIEIESAKCNKHNIKMDIMVIVDDWCNAYSTLKCSYGDLSDFRRSTTPQFNAMITTAGLNKLTKPSVDTVKTAWSF